jgi:hypothetical protein
MVNSNKKEMIWYMDAKGEPTILYKDDVYHMDGDGYYKNIKNSFMSLHREIYMEYYDVVLTKYDIIHHIDHNPANNVIENLQLMTRGEHSSYHRKYEDLRGERNNFYGKHHTEEQKKKWGAKRKGKNNFMTGRTGKKHPNYGMKHSEETRKKITEKQTGELNHFYGKRHSKETKEKISKAKLKLTETQRFTVSKMLDFNYSYEHICKIFNISSTTLRSYMKRGLV